MRLRLFLMFSLLAVVLGASVAGGGYWAYWNFYARWRPVTIVKNQADIQKLASAVSIPFIPADTSKENYTVDHSGNLVIIGPDGSQRGFIRAPLNNDKLAAQLPQLLLSDG